MIRLRPESTAYATSDAAIPDSAGESITATNTVLDSQNASAVVDSMKQPTATVTDSIKATLSESIAAKAVRGIEFMSMPAEAGFDVTKALGDSASQYTGDELEFLSDARSAPELKQRAAQVQTDRDNYRAMGQNMLATVAASMLDIDTVIGMGVGALPKVARAGRLAVGLAANSAVLGVASQGGEITALDVVGTSVGVAMGAIPKVRRAEKLAEDVVEGAERPAAATTEKAAKYVPDEDYVPTKVDTATTKQHIEVGAHKAFNGDVIRTDMNNAVRAVVNLGDDLPEGQRLLGRALADSLDADGAVPVVFRKRTGDERSFVKLSQNGDLQSTVQAAEVGADLTSHVKAMSTYDKTILLHEAAHAKTVRTLQAVRAGTVTSGPQFDAAKRIGEIRQYVQDKSLTQDLKGLYGNKGAYNVKYGMSNDDEFIAQMFNSDDFRKHLQSIKMPGSEGTVWSELVKKVVQAFTGKAPEGTAFDALVHEFDNLMQVPQVASDIKLKAPSPIPEVQSPMLKGAKTVQDFSDKAQRTINENFALHDRIASIGPKASEMASKLVVDATGTEANSAAHYARTAHLAANTAIVQVDSAMAQALRAEWPLAQRLRHPVLYKQAQRDLSDKVYAQLAENHTRYRAGQTIDPSADQRVESVVQAFTKSKWAEDSLERIKAAGVEGAENIESSPYYLPRQHSGDKMSRFLRENADVSRDDVIGMYTSQFKRMFADKGIEDATAKKLGTQMVRNMEQRAAHVQGYRQSVAGMSYDDITDALVNAGVDEAQVAQFMGEVKVAGTEANKVRNLRGRAEFNMTEEYVTSAGRSINPQMFVNSDTLGLMEGYSRRMSGRIGLARAGFADIKDMVKQIDEAAAQGTNPAEALQTLDNTVNQLLGYPTGENVPDILRSLSIVGSSVNLANSGIYQLADMGLMLQQFGVTKTFKALAGTKFGRDAMDVARSAEYGARLQDVLEARNVMSGKFRSILTHLEDNHDIGSLGVAHQYVQQMGQGTRFANGMEFVRRAQSKMVAGLIGDTVDDAIRGNAAAVTAMKRFGLSDDVLARVRAATAKNPDMREWPSDLRLDMETIAHNMADSVVLENRLGEIPAWMQFSSVGKVVLPYMTFVAGAWNKILRRTGKLDGTTGIAMAFAYQLPLATIAATASLTLGGQDVTPEKIMTKAITQVPLMSWLGFGVDFVSQGPTNSIAALSIIDKMYSATSSVAKGEVDPATLIKAVPFLGIMPGMRLLGTSLSDDD